MKSFLIIGAGTLGHHLCEEFSQLKCETMVVDREEKRLENLLSVATSCRIADCSSTEALSTLGVRNFDACFVCIGHDFEQSLVVTSLLKEMGARKVYSLADEDIQAKFLLRNGADEVIYPQKDVAKNIALSESNDSIFDCIRMSGEYGIYEIVANPAWIGKSIGAARIRNNHDLSILAIKKGEELIFAPSVDYVFNSEDHLLVLGKDLDVRKISLR